MKISITKFCDQCDYKSKSNYEVKCHVEAKHEGVCYSCDHCGYKAKRKTDLHTHIESQHEGICYSCDQCGYKAKQRGHLKQHVDSQHKEIIFKCKQCDNQSSRKDHLESHIKTIHDQNQTSLTEFLKKVRFEADNNTESIISSQEMIQDARARREFGIIDQ